jgi:hypothetical protein
MYVFQMRGIDGDRGRGNGTLEGTFNWEVKVLSREEGKKGMTWGMAE